MYANWGDTSPNDWGNGVGEVLVQSGRVPEEEVVSTTEDTSDFFDLFQDSSGQKSGLLAVAKQEGQPVSVGDSHVWGWEMHLHLRNWSELTNDAKLSVFFRKQGPEDETLTSGPDPEFTYEWRD